MFRLKEIKVEKMTRDLAEWIGNLPPVDRERELNAKRVNGLGKKLIDGLVLPFIWAIAVVDGVFYRVNGQHSSAVIMDSWEKWERSGFVAIVCTFECGSMEDAVELWSQYDSLLSARKAGEIYKVMAAAHPQLAGVPDRVVALCATGFSMDKFSFVDKEGFDANGRMQIVCANTERVLFVSEVLSGGNAKYLARGAVVAAMSRTYQRCQADAKKFWDEVKTGSNPDVNSGSRQLQRKLMQTSVAYGAGAKNGKTCVPPPLMFTWCIRCWNAWRKGELILKVAGIVDGKLPEAA